MSLVERVRDPQFHKLIMSAQEAAAMIPHGANVGMSGFTGAGYPKGLPQAIAARANAEHAQGRPYKINVWTGASTAAECDGVMAEAGALGQRLPFNTDPTARKAINAGEIDFIDMHLSHVAQHAWFGFLGHMHVAVVEVLGITEDGLLIPSTAVGNNKTWLEIADKVILEVNTKPPAKMEGMHDIYYGTAIPPRRMPINMTQADERIGQPYLKVDPAKVIAVVET
ncbi:MAG: propionyl-CoA--succinate CoA transferase, partial [Comamonas sp.]|nr:propionyl-CoA--succinate CoA transferase [Candidatus Comamonas equi]